MSTFVNDESPVAASPDWLLTYGDLMSLLLTFFIMLVSMSELKSNGSVQRAVESMQQRFGRDEGENDAPGRRRGLQIPAPVGGNAQARLYGGGRASSLGGSIYFAEDATAPDEAEQTNLLALAERLQGKAQRIEIRGHTTRRPTAADGPYKDHWELAFARCREVQRRLVEAGIDPKRVRLGVAGANEPGYLGDDPLGLRANSRVDVFLLNEFTGSDGEAAASADASQTAR